MKKIIPIVKEKAVQEVPSNLDDKHLKIMEAILPFAKPAEQKNLTEVVFNNVTRKSKVLFFLLPEWAKNFPPYNLARLVAVAKENGYQAEAVDLNVKAWRDHKNWDIDFDPWHGSKEWRWMGQSYHEHLHVHLLPLLEKYIKKIEEDNITVVGFSYYYCNQEPTDWMASEIKKRYPHVKTLVGGPQCHAFPPGEDKPYYDYVISGEGEQILLEVLEEIENGNTVIEQRTIRQQDGERLNLDLLPRADYSDFDFSEYGMPNGVNAEFSRGCTAKCVFCSETHFWKYRGRKAGGILEEVLDLYNNRGVNYIWFLDSLVNGNLKELRAFCKGIIASGAKINWTGYARCDKRMDFEYMKDLAASGCHMLSYGIESGSNKVLADMDKRVTVDEIEQNLQHGGSLGITAHSNWIVGFPTELPQDFYESMTLVWRNRDCISVVAAGHGFTEPPDTILSQNSEKYGMIKSYYMNNWITGDFKNSKVHRQIRLITMSIFLDNTPSTKSKHSLANFDVSKYHTIEFKDSTKFNQIEFEQFDFDIIKPNINPLADSVVNEVWPLLRLLWRSRGAYSIVINIDKDKSYAEFGDRLGCDLTADYKFQIDEEGNWSADFDFDFNQDANAWKYQDYSRETSMSARRARILALPGSEGEVQWNHAIYDVHMAALEKLKSTDFSFKFNYKGTGKW
jgi:radical SAM superfamily enzyme YgiQ (UPF0313 family)